MIVEALAAAALAATPPIGVGVALDRATAAPGDHVAVRIAEAPSKLRLYLVPASARPRSRFDARIHFVARALRGASPTFVVPPVDSGSYALGVWCPRCRPTFFIAGRTLLRVDTPAATDACPVTLPDGGPPPGLQPGRWYGNGSLWTHVASDGVFVAPPGSHWEDGPPGSIGTKLFWYAAGIDDDLVVSGRRLDAPTSPLLVHRVNRGWTPGFRGSATWATPVSFPTEGCWRLTARVADVKLTFVVKVEAP